MESSVYYVYIEKFNSMYGPCDFNSAYLVREMTPGAIILEKIVDEFGQLNSNLEQNKGC